MTHRRHPFAAAGGGALPILLLLLLAVGAAVAQPSPGSNNNSSNNNNNPYGFSPNFNPSMAIVIVVLVSAFFFLGFFSIYIRQCGGGAGSDSVNPLTRARGGGAARSRHQRGLDPEVLATFPTLVYSEVKVLKIGKGDLECAVCLSEFDEDETLRLLPGCSHVFHPDCIDAWLASHVTCPVCRSNLAEVHVVAPAAAAEPPEQVAVEVDPGEEERKADLAELARIASRRRGGAPLPRSHSTGHSLVDQAGSRDRFTLRLPEHIRKEIVAAGRMQRAESLRGFPLHREGSSRRGYRAGGGAAEGSSRSGRSVQLGRTERWPSILLRNFSARLPAWGRRWDREGSMKNPGGEDREVSMKGRPSSVRGGAPDAGGGSGADRV